jgi:hypothetical protein
MHNGNDPDRMSPAERLDEVALLLAAAMLRLWRKRTATSSTGERTPGRWAAEPHRCGRPHAGATSIESKSRPRPPAPTALPTTSTLPEWPERAFSRDSGGNPLGCPAETPPPVTAGEP